MSTTGWSFFARLDGKGANGLLSYIATCSVSLADAAVDPADLFSMNEWGEEASNKRRRFAVGPMVFLPHQAH